MPTYKLTYFNVRGRAELSRYVFYAAGRDFEDNRVTGDQWKEEALKAKSPFGQLPFLEVDGKPIAQSNSIARFLAREFGLAGKDSMEQARADALLELGNDLIKEIVTAMFEKDEKKKEELQKNLGEVVFPKFLGMLDKALAANGGGKYFVGNALTVADLAVYCMFDTPLMKNPKVMDTFPKLKAHRAMVAGVPKLAEYIKNRAVTDI